VLDTFLGFGWLLGVDISPQKVQEVMVAPAGG
jgi:hypothetical protein